MSWRAVRVVVACVASLANANEIIAAKGDPVVRLIEPERGERRFVAPASILLEAQAKAAPQRSIVRVEFFSGDMLIGATSAAPHAITWSNVPEGEYRLRARATDNTGAADWSPFVRVRVRANREPRVRLTEPAQDAQFSAQQTIALSAVARDRDHNLARVDFYADGTLIGSATTKPYRVSWQAAPPGAHILVAKAIDTLGATDESRPIRIHVTGTSGGAKLYFIHVDHLNTPRLIADDQQRTVWKWDQQEPFGANPPDENPSGLGPFEFPARFPGQYFDKETNLHYNYFRDYDPSLGRYIESDPIGFLAGINTYAYVLDSPLSYIDPFGLDVKVCYYYDAAGGFGHIGYGIASESRTSGYYPTGKLFGSPGIVKEDEQQMKECKVVPASPDQDQCMLKCRARRKTNPGFYNLTTNQCTSFVRECLNECDLPTGNSGGSAPRPLFLRLPGQVQ